VRDSSTLAMRIDSDRSSYMDPASNKLSIAIAHGAMRIDSDRSSLHINLNY
jgi:hypothetical protein